MYSYLVSRPGPQSRKFSKVNTGFWMDQQLHKMHKPKNVEKLKQSVVTDSQSVPAGMLTSSLTVWTIECKLLLR